MTAARVFIGRSRSGSVFHIVRNAGTAFPEARCGSFVERRGMVSVNLETLEGFPVRTVQLCKRCEREQS
jgi:hypothetical protein